MSPNVHAPLPGPLPASRGEGDETRGALPASRGEGDETHGAVEEDWIPPKNSVPFGPFLVAGALEWLWLGHLFVRWIPTLSVFR